MENNTERSDFLENKYIELFNNSINGIAIHKIVYDSDKKPINYIIINVNPRFESILSLKKGEVINKLATEVYDVEIPPFLDIYAKVAETLESVEFSVFFEPMNKHFKISVYSFEKGMFITTFDDLTQQVQAIQQYKESEEKYREILDNLDLGYYEVDLKGNYTFANKFQANYLGLSKEELVGTNYNVFYDKEEEKRVFEKYNEVYNKNLPKGLLEVETKGLNGIKRTFEASFYLKHDSNGKKIGFYGVIYDISERKKLELELAALNQELEQKVDIRTKELSESEEKWRSLAKNAPNIIIIADLDGEIQFLNRSVTSNDIKELIGRSIYEYIHPEYHDIVKRTIKRVLDTGESGSYEAKAITQQGRILWFETHVGPISQGEKIVNVLMISTDITERKEAEQKLKESEERYRSLFENMNAGFAYHKVITNDNNKPIDYKYLEVNPAFEKLTGLNAGDMIGKNVTEILPGTENDPADWIGKFGNVGLTGVPLIVEDYSDAIDKWFKVSGYSPKKGFFAVTFTDITERKKTEEKLRESEEQFRTFAEQSFMGITIIQDGVMKYINQKLADIHKRSMEQLLNFKPQDFLKSIHSDERGKAIEEMNALMKGDKQISNFEMKSIREDGKIIWLNQFSKKIEYNGRPAILTNIIDITERKEYELKLKELDDIINRSSAVVFLWRNSEGWPVEFVTENIKQFGYNPTEFLSGKISYAEIVHKDDLERIGEEVLNYSESGVDEYTQEYRILTKEGKVCWIDDRTRIRRNTKGEATHFQGIIWDITERKLLEENLKKSEKRYRHLFENSPNMIILLDSHGRISNVNTPFLNIFNYKEDEIIGKNFQELDDVSLETSPIYKRKFKEIFENGILEPFELQTEVKGVLRRWMSIQASLIDIEGKKILQVIFQDINDRKVAELKLKKSEKKFREAYNRAEFYKDLFAHDISNILQHILSAMELSDLLINNPENLKDIQANLNIIKDQVYRGAKLVSNVRKLSQLEEYKKSIKPIEIVNIIKSSFTFIKNSYQEREIDIQADFLSNEVYIQANDLIQDVFENILINSVKHNNNPKVEIIVKFSREVFEQIHYLKIEFIDNGEGIEDARKETIFQRAYNEDISVSGMGLGLSLVKKIIDSFNGKIWVEDKVKDDYSKGSNFIILLPEK